ncbi:GNAT family N-acetyltransferase [Granulicella arctica]|uniref:GNAT family N-acetyltransferase n=1 Tax=Granulicella arctica TaxID=940613 RepID=UPI0021DFDF69|nr:GNAT family N-acetyltransferase [Granulicella arctica]
MSFAPRDEIHTPRLTLIAITPEMLHAEQANDGSLAAILNCTLPLNWPPVDWEPHVLDILLAQFERHPHQSSWHRYITLPDVNGTSTLIGMVGAFWRDTAPAECEIGYTILPPWEGRGFATEAVRALIDVIRNDQQIQPPLTSIMAHTLPHLLASIRILEKCGLTFEGPGEEANTIRYRLHLNK